MKCKILLFLIFLICCSNNHIIQRASSDYFPLAEGNWWRYVSSDDTLLIEIEPLDTILQTECFPVSAGGYVRYLAKDDESISEYINIVYNFAGETYTIIENFIMRIELPLIEGNVYEDSLVDSLNLFGQWIKAKYHISGEVAEYEYRNDFFEGDVYKLEISTTETLISPDTTIINTNYEEYYAPDIGLVQFVTESIEYNIIQYYLN